MNSETYTDRSLHNWTIAKIEDGATTDVEGWTTSASPELLSLVKVGDTIQRETQGRSSFGTCTGWLVGDRWVGRKSDQDIERDRQQFRDDMDRRHREALERNREQWTVRSAELPAWARDRIDVFRERGGEKFELEGWGYELCVCELAVMYASNDCTDDERIDAYSKRYGTSGNQHECAKSLARAHAQGTSLAGTVSALSPITGDAFYTAGAS